MSLRFPIPLCSLTSLIRGMDTRAHQTDSLRHIGFITFGPHQPACSVREGFVGRGLEFPYIFKQVTTLSKMFTPRHPFDEYKRLVLDVHLFDVFGMSRSVKTGPINEVLQIDLCPYGLLDILIHISTRSDERVLYHKKFYGLTEQGVQNLQYKLTK
jgi:hypothetical protein